MDNIDQQYLEYELDGKKFELFVCNPNGGKKNPAVLVCHAWAGRDEFACNVARRLASDEGVVGIAIDLYGKGVLGNSVEENTKLMTPLVEDRSLLKKRLLKALEMAKEFSFVDSQQIVVMGYCFGGLCALDMARSGVELAGVASFHGLLSPLAGTDTQKINTKVLVLHGYDDPMVPPQDLLDFAKEMKARECRDWQLHAYGETLHAFTNPQAKDPQLGAIYHPTNNRRSWRSFQNFIAEVFNP